jgi:hypothetical protein
MLITLQRKVIGFTRQSRFSQLWFIPLWVLLGFCKVAIVMVSFRRLAPHLGTSVGVASWIPLLDSIQEARALQIGRAVKLASRYTPWESNCFPQAVAARLLLSLYRVPYALYFGVKRDPVTGEIKAHAWVAAGRVAVTGGASFGQFSVVACFVSSQLIDTSCE